MPSEDEYLDDMVRLWQRKQVKSKSASQQRDAAAGRHSTAVQGTPARHPSGGASTSAPSSQPAKQRKWRPRQTPRLSRDDYIVVVKPRVPCELRTFVPATEWSRLIARATPSGATSVTGPPRKFKCGRCDLCGSSAAGRRGANGGHSVVDRGLPDLPFPTSAFGVLETCVWRASDDVEFSMCDISDRMHCLAERRSKIGKYANAMRSSDRPRALQTCGNLFQRATPRAFVWFAARLESSKETRASLTPRFPPCATEPSDESYVVPSERKRREREERDREAGLKLECERRERDERAREAELALAREVAALEERNRQLRLRLLEAENAARARAPVHVNSVSFMDPRTWSSDELNEAKDSFGSKLLKGRLESSACGRHSEFYEEASMPVEKCTDAHRELKNEAKKGLEPERRIASRDRMERSGSFRSDAPMQTGTLWDMVDSDRNAMEGDSVDESDRTRELMLEIEALKLKLELEKMRSSRASSEEPEMRNRHTGIAW
ncbi:hypothetical protein HPB50_008844 [Hyalomma asiaticum]|uniref:Uncharacterized protein n=1 Tax=Hyalomma asiaticum TaxID=266040 RepID=A0ACB7RHW9_HYAAI|nr:hypothetical protein HPB50_008844 [Hyalomma asiaticum]